MPKRDSDEPKCIRPYSYHGVDFSKRDTKTWVGLCPFCDKPKFHVDSESGQFTCFTCPSSAWKEQYPEERIAANHYGFIRYLWRVSFENTKEIDYSWIEAHRKLPAKLLREWGVCKSITTGEWLVPGYGIEDKPNITQLYKYVKLYSKEKGEYYDLLPTPGFAEGESHGILLPRDYSGDADRLYCTEGVWDAIALSSALPVVREASLRGAIVGVPGCGIYNKAWNKYLKDKDVVFLFDNDHYKVNEKTGLPQQPGFTGTKRAVGIVGGEAKSISYLDWGSDGRGYDPTLSDGYDVRDWLAKDHKSIDNLLLLVSPVPDEWLEKGKATSYSGGNPDNERIKPLKCQLWNELTTAFKLAAKWTPELNGALAVALACVCSVRGEGEPLWTRLISPPSTYKSQLCKALGTNEFHTIMDDGMTGFYSGMDLGDGKDYSLVTKWFDKCLITKEGSTLFTNSNSEQIIGEARAIYDGEVDRRWKNGKHVSHRGWRGTWLLAGTPDMKNYDDNELGPRFIDYRIVKDIDTTLHMDILMRAMIEQNSAGISNCKPGSGDNADYLKARQLCAGYVDYLRAGIDSQTLLVPQLPMLFLNKIAALAMFIEQMRGRPSRKYASENVESALAARVCKQLIKLARFLCVVTQRESIDDWVMAVVYKVAMDTSDGWSQEIVNVLIGASKEGDESLMPETIAKRCSRELKEMGSLINYLQKIKVMEMYTPPHVMMPSIQGRLRLTKTFHGLYNQVRGMNYKL